MNIPRDVWHDFMVAYTDLTMLKPWMTPEDASLSVWAEMKERLLKERYKVIEMVTGKPPHEQAKELLIEAELKTRAAQTIIDNAK